MNLCASLTAHQTKHTEVQRLSESCLRADPPILPPSLLKASSLWPKDALVL